MNLPFKSTKEPYCHFYQELEEAEPQVLQILQPYNHLHQMLELYEQFQFRHQLLQNLPKITLNAFSGLSIGRGDSSQILSYLRFSNSPD